MFNRVILMGRICHDLELKTTPNGVPVLSFRIAVDRNYQAKGEERKSDFFNIVAWRSSAEFVNRYFGKGRMILVEGELQTRQYVDKNNVTQNITEIIVDNVSFTGEPKQSSGGSGSYGGNAPQHPAEVTNTPPTMSQGTAQDFVESAADDDYPF